MRRLIALFALFVVAGCSSGTDEAVETTASTTESTTSATEPAPTIGDAQECVEEIEVARNNVLEFVETGATRAMADNAAPAGAAAQARWEADALRDRVDNAADRCLDLVGECVDVDGWINGLHQYIDIGLAPTETLVGEISEEPTQVPELPDSIDCV